MPMPLIAPKSRTAFRFCSNVAIPVARDMIKIPPFQAPKTRPTPAGFGKMVFLVPVYFVAIRQMSYRHCAHLISLSRKIPSPSPQTICPLNLHWNRAEKTKIRTVSKAARNQTASSIPFSLTGEPPALRPEQH
jgi:hypothetical protein